MRLRRYAAMTQGYSPQGHSPSGYSPSGYSPRRGSTSIKRQLLDTELPYLHDLEVELTPSDTQVGKQLEQLSSLAEVQRFLQGALHPLSMLHSLSMLHPLSVTPPHRASPVLPLRM